MRTDETVLVQKPGGTNFFWKGQSTRTSACYAFQLSTSLGPKDWFFKFSRHGQQRPTAASSGQQRPTEANSGQQRPTAAVFFWKREFDWFIWLDLAKTGQAREYVISLYISNQRKCRTAGLNGSLFHTAKTRRESSFNCFPNIVLWSVMSVPYIKLTLSSYIFYFGINFCPCILNDRLIYFYVLVNYYVILGPLHYFMSTISNYF